MRFGFRELIFLIVLLGLPIAAWVFVFQPINNEIELVRGENAAKQVKLEKLHVSQHIENVGQEIDKLAEAIHMFEAKLPAEKEVEVILREVWQLATDKGLRPRSVRTEKPVISPLYSELPIKMEIIGDFDGFYAFMLDVEQLSRITRIFDMKLKKLKDTEGHMNASFTLTIYFEPESNGSAKEGV
jgi:type IV pilus assembly protein PilO